MNGGITAGGMPGQPVQFLIGPPKASASEVQSNGYVNVVGRGDGAYDAASFTSQELSAWHPKLESADSEIIPSRDKIVARSRSLDRNNGWAHSGVDKRVDMVVGSNTWLRAKPNFTAMGQTPEWADDWSIQTEALFNMWANSSRFLCDVERHQHFGGIIRMAYQHYVLDGEALAAIYMLPRGGIFDTAALVIDPDRLTNPDGKPDSEFLRGGVELDQYGAATAYHVRKGHITDLSGDFDSARFVRVPREGPTGRPLCVHVFDKRRAHQRRGVGRLVSVMGRMKMLGSYDKVELQAAITNATFGLYAKTQRSSEEMKESMVPVGDDIDDLDAIDEMRAGFYEKNDLTFDGVRVAVIPAGDELATIEAVRPHTNFGLFQRAFLNSIAGALGISGEQLSNDWQGINYSSARTLLNEIWRGLLSDRRLFTQAFATPIYAAWLEEAVARDMVKIPGGQSMFYVFRDALTQCDWVGPGRGSIDPKKEADAGQVNRDGLVSTLEQDCLDQGYDWRDTIWQAKRESEALKKFGLTVQRSGAAANAGADAEANAQDTADAGETAQGTRTNG